MRALVGDDDALWKPLPGFFTPGTPLYTEEGGEILKGPRNLDAAKTLLAESGYAGQPVTCVVAQDQPITKAQGDVTADLLKRLGMNVDFVADRLGHDRPAPRHEERRRARAAGTCSTPGMPAPICINPVVLHAIRANGDKAWFGWPTCPRSRPRSTHWFEAASLDEEKAAMRRLNRAAIEDVVYAPTGFFLRLPGLAQERLGRREGAAALLLGRLARRHESRVTIGRAMLDLRRSGASSPPSRSWRSSRCSSSACSTSRPATRRR